MSLAGRSLEREIDKRLVEVVLFPLTEDSRTIVENNNNDMNCDRLL